MEACMLQIKRNESSSRSPRAADRTVDENPFFSFIERFRVVALTSPLWLGAIMTFGGLRVQGVVDFLTTFSQK
jgi:hypothetical protein